MTNIIKRIPCGARDDQKNGESPRHNVVGTVGMLCLLVLLFICPAVHARSTNSAGVQNENAFMVVRTNMLYDVLLVPNIGVEVWLPMNFTIGADWFGNWIRSDKRNLCWQGYGGYLTFRYYFGKAAEEQPFTGHHVGIYGSGLTYDVELGGIGYQATKFGFGGGVEYGYSLPVAHRLCVDFTIGVGYQGGEYKTYRPTNDGTGHYEWLSTRKRHWFGPTKAEISLKVLIGSMKKGGRK